MAPSEVLIGIAKDVKDITARIAEAKDLIGAMKEAGEDVSKLQTDLRDQEIRKQRWERMLEARGMSTK